METTVLVNPPNHQQGVRNEDGIRCSSQRPVCIGMLPGGSRPDQEPNVPTLPKVPVANRVGVCAVRTGEQTKESRLSTVLRSGVAAVPRGPNLAVQIGRLLI
jgi:hypothetical protein